ncbi:CLUMA_CG012077, isoform A [Clunio marinus]|uniref:CLUMA_CG012077, isoform A n=1 Tax=Clunio marinus TaxID=568069 RepID=A0A1J1IF42_9DIPT|nr:CLUMA_CG012077, isoform A [Clunio marinus]
MNLETGAYGDCEVAGKMLEEYDKKDLQISVESALTNQGSYSGLNDFDYQDLANLTEGRLKDLSQLRTLNKIPIPNEIMDHFKNIKCHCRMGLFPEIGRAWLTIDSDIYIWTYEHSRDVAYFDGLSHLIVSVGLIEPKKNVFINDVKYLLVLTTPIEIIILGVTFGDTTKTISSPSRSFISSTYEEMQLMNKPIFVINTDNISMTCIKGSSDGRIFLGGRDGCLYEVTYQAESNWFGKRCKKVNHSQGLISLVVPGFLKVFSESDAIAKIEIDNERNLLYTLSENGAIEAWDLSDNSARRITRLSQNDLANAAANIIKTVDSSVFKPVVDICVLMLGEYSALHLIAVTQSGVRMYMSAYHSNVQSMIDLQIQQYRIQNLSLQHVRLPPGYTPNATCGKPRNIHSAFCCGGSTLMISTPQQDLDILWSLSSEPFLHTELTPLTETMRRSLAESSTTANLDGQVWAVAEMRDKSSMTMKFPLRESRKARKLILLTTQGAHIVELLKSVDFLQQVLVSCHGAHHDAVKAFFDIHTEPEACATSLMLACMESMIGTELSAWAKQAFFRYGGEPLFFTQQQMLQQMQSGAAESPRIFMSTPYAQSRAASQIQQSLMHQTQFGGGNNTTFQSSSQQQQPQQMDICNLKYSAKHGGLYLHIARILRPIWNRKCIDTKNLTSTITIHDCNQILNDLFGIRSFIESNSVIGLMKMSSTSDNMIMSQSSFMTSHHHHQLNGNHQMNHQHLQKRDEAYGEEKKSLDALAGFIRYVCEVVGLWKILCEHQLHVLVTQLTVEQRQVLDSCNFREIILYRNELCALLIVTLINTYLNDNASVKLISEKLRDVCPSLYRNEDAVSHKATEILKLSRTCTNDDERMEGLSRALNLCCQAAPKLPLPNICQQFTAAGFYEGVIKLCLTFANKFDPNESGLHFYKNNYPFDMNQIQQKDQDGFIAFTTRMKCYEEVKNMFQYLFVNGNEGQASGSRIITPQLHNVLNIALQSQDQLLHVAVYEWMLYNGLYNQILDISNSSLGDFLARSVNQMPVNLELADLLWKYYERNGQHQSAAKILDKLATMPSENVNLSKRIEYLARAVMCMRSATVGYAAHHGEFLRDLEDKLDISQVQKQIYDTMTSARPRNIDALQARDAIKTLDMRLLNMSQLYSDFAEKFNLWESQLMILNCSHHNEPLLISSVWSRILDNEQNEPGSPAEKAKRLLSKVQSLSNDYGVGPCFPLSFLIDELEKRCFDLNLPNSPVPEMLLQMNLEIDQILDSYVKIVTSIISVDFFLIRSVKRLLQLILQNNLSSSKNRRRTIAKIEELVSATLNVLYKTQGNEMQQLTADLREIRQNLASVN